MNWEVSRKVIDPTIGSRLQDASQEEVDRLLGEIATEFFARISNGESPRIEDYTARHPQLAAMIRQALTALQVVGESVADGKTRGFSGTSGGDSSSVVGTEKQLGDFRILQELGRGGMGVVYEAEQISMGGRRVALKVLPFAAMADPRHLQRFHNEVRAAASLDHPNIVSVYSVGQDRGVHFYAMRLIRGQSMGRLIQELAELRRHTPLSAVSVKEAISSPSIPAPSSGNTDPTEAWSGEAIGKSGKKARAGESETAAQPQALISTKGNTKRSDYYEAIADLAIQAAEALEHAHERGVTHRDIKPANLMIDAFSQLYITDFGLAHIEEGVGMTMTGDLIGTLRYMSPEQAMGKRVVVDYRTDIYSLGVSLYELLTTQPAFDGENRAAMLKQIAFEEPRKLTQVDPSIPRDLETIVHKAMAKSPDERYASAQELADDLRAFRACQPIMAKPPNAVDRLRKFTRRNQGLVTAAMIMMLLAIIGLAISNSMVAAQRVAADAARAAEQGQREESERQRNRAEEQSREAGRQRSEAERLQLQAESQRNEAVRSLYLADMRLSSFDLANENIPRLQETLAAYVPIARQDDLRRWEWHYLLAASDQSERTLLGHLRAVSDLAWSPDGRWLATVGEDEGFVVIWDLKTWKPYRQLKEGFVVIRGAAWSPDGDSFAWGDAHGTIRVWHSKTDQIRVLQSDGGLLDLAWSPDGRQLASVGDGDACQVWEVDRLECIDTLKVGSPRAVSWNSSGERLCIAAWSALISWDPVTGETKRQEADGFPELECVTYTLDDQHIIAGDAHGNIVQYSAKSLEIVRFLSAHSGMCSCIDVVDDERFVTGGMDGILRLWDLKDGQLIRTWRGHSSGVHSVDWNPTRSLLASSDAGAAVKIWDLKRQGDFATIHTADPKGRNWNKWDWRPDQLKQVPDSNSLAYLQGFADAKIVPLEIGREPYLRKPRSVFDLRLVPQKLDASKIASLARRELEQGVVELPSEQEFSEILGGAPRSGPTASVYWSPDRSKVAIQGDIEGIGNCVQVWDVPDERLLQVDGPLLSIRDLAWSADSRMLAYTGRERHAKVILVLIDAEHGTVIQRNDYFLPGSLESTCVCWHPDGSKVATADETGVVMCWRTETGERLDAHQVFQSEVVSLAWSPDGDRIAASGTNREVKVLDAHTLAELLTLHLPEDMIMELEWCQGGRSLVGKDAMGRIVRWDASRGYEKAQSEEFEYECLLTAYRQASDAKQYEAAEDCLKRMLKLKPENLQLTKSLGGLQSAQNVYEESIDSFTRYLQAFPDDQSAIHRRALAYQKRDSYERARRT